MSENSAADARGVPAASAAGRWLIVAAVLGSGVAFIDGTVVNVALPAIRTDLNASVSSLQWVIDIYTLVLASLLMVSGATADRYGRKGQ